MRKSFSTDNFIEKEVALTIRVPATFNKQLEQKIDAAFADALFDLGCELIDSKEYTGGLTPLNILIDFDKLRFQDFDDTGFPLQFFYAYEADKEILQKLVSGWGYKGEIVKAVTVCLNLCEPKSCPVEAVITFTDNDERWVDLYDAGPCLGPLIDIVEKSDSSRAPEAFNLYKEYLQEHEDSSRPEYMVNNIFRICSDRGLLNPETVFEEEDVDWNHFSEDLYKEKIVKLAEPFLKAAISTVAQDMSCTIVPGSICFENQQGSSELVFRVKADSNLSQEQFNIFLQEKLSSLIEDPFGPEYQVFAELRMNYMPGEFYLDKKGQGINSALDAQIHKEVPMNVYDQLREKILAELEEFQASYKDMEIIQVYNDWYIIGFYNSYADLFTSEHIGNFKFEEEAKWLLSFEKPLGTLYHDWLSSDGAMSYDWNDMISWVQDNYATVLASREMDKQRDPADKRPLEVQIQSASNRVARVSGTPVFEEANIVSAGAQHKNGTFPEK